MEDCGYQLWGRKLEVNRSREKENEICYTVVGKYQYRILQCQESSVQIVEEDVLERILLDRLFQVISWFLGCYIGFFFECLFVSLVFRGFYFFIDFIIGKQLDEYTED